MNILELTDEQLNNMSVEELTALHKQATDLESLWETNQMTKKILLNSLYGALGNKHFVLFNPEIGAAITGNGRYTNKTMAYSIDSFLKQKLPNDKPYLIYGDTDSVVGETIVTLMNKNIKIEDLYNDTEGVTEYKSKDNFVKRPFEKIMACSMNSNKEVEYKPINYIMAHKVKKRMFKITVNGDNVTVTEDHSIIVLRNDELISCSAKDIIKGDKLIKILS